MQNANKVTLLLTLAGLCAGLVSCESSRASADKRQLPTGTPLAMRAPKPYDASSTPVSKPLGIADRMYATAHGPRLVERITMTGGTRTIADGVPGFEANGAGARVVKVQYEAESASLDEVLAVLISEYLERDYVIESGITGLVNLSIDEDLDEGELERFVGGLCSLYGLRLSEQDGRYIIRKSAGNTAKGGAVPPSAPIYTAEPLLGNEMPAIRLRKLRFASPENVKTLLTELMSAGSLVSTSDQLLVLVDTTSQLKRMGDIIEALDVPAFENTELSLFELGSLRSEDAQTRLAALATSTGLSGTNTLVSFVAMPNDRDLLVIAKDPSASRQAEMLINLIDRPIDSPARGSFSYDAQHTSASSLVNAFSQFFPDRVESEDNPNGVRFVQFATSSLSFGITSELSGGAGGAGSARKILIYASPSDYEDMLTLFAELDRPPQQVNMRVVVAEVALTDTFEFGVQYALNAMDSNNSGDGIGDLDLFTDLASVTSAANSLIFNATDGFAIIEALDFVSDITLLSSPTISAVHGGLASINVGGEEPIPGGIETTSGGNSTNNVERRETGITIEAQPFINGQGEVRIRLNVDIASLGADRGEDLGPSFTTRIIETEILTKHGQTYLIGGIIIDNSVSRRDQIPGLGDLPLLGSLFGTESDSTNRTELIIAITPTIANTPDEADVFMDDFLRSTHAVREALAEREEDLAQGFLFDRIGTDDQLAPVEGPVEVPIEPDAVAVPPLPEVEQSPEAEEPAADPKKELDIPPIIRRMLESGGSTPPKSPESDG